jgi:hypothetical protein
MDNTFIRQWVQLSVTWTAIALVPLGRVFLVDPFFSQAWFYVIVLAGGLLLCPLLVIWFTFLQNKKQSWLKIIIVQFAFAVLLSLWYYYAVDENGTVQKKRTSSIELKQMTTEKKFNFYLFGGSSYSIFASFMLLSGLGLLISYNEQLRQRKNKEAELKLTLVRSQVKALQSELQPHFLFNTLHAASSLMEVDVAKAQQLIERLSFLLRNYLDIIGREFYTLEEELAFIEEYIEIQKLRHNGSIRTDMGIPDECMQLKVPVVLLQPILENSVKHGWVNRKQPLQIQIRVEMIKNSLHILVKDNGSATGISEKPGIGIRNLKERLNALYGNNYTYTEGSGEGYYSQLILPLQT